MILSVRQGRQCSTTAPLSLSYILIKVRGLSQRHENAETFLDLKYRHKVVVGLDDDDVTVIFGGVTSGRS